MLTPLAWPLLLLVKMAVAHGSHEYSGPEDGETNQQYAQRHMAKEHHIDSFDARSFFQLHDLGRNGYWDEDEIKAIYGVHHTYSKKQSKDDEAHRQKADYIVKEVLLKLDLDKDGKISQEELESVGLDALPNFDKMGAEGHHYDEESEFFLHHEEEFHSTPETQTDESYNHPEDLNHFQHHEAIENKETEREAVFQGVTVDELVQQRLAAAQAAEQAASAVASNAAAVGNLPVEPSGATGTAPSKPGVTRVTPPEKQDPAIKYADAKERSSRTEEWGTGQAGYKTPIEAEEKMRRGLPYKYKFRRNWGDF